MDQDFLSKARLIAEIRRLREKVSRLESGRHAPPRTADIRPPSDQFLDNIFESIQDPLCIIDARFTMVRANSAYARLKGREVSALVGSRCFEVLHGRGKVCGGCIVNTTFLSSHPSVKEKRVTFSEGHEAWLEISTHPIIGEGGRVTHVIEYMRDITERKRAETEKKLLIEKLEHLSRTDGLTGLLNRRALMERLENEIRRTQRYSRTLSLILCDIDQFKEVNDSYGHSVGDEVLRRTARTLSDSLRKADVIGRYGGDEFMIILPETSVHHAAALGRKLCRTVSAASQKADSGEPIRITLSFGVASFWGADVTMENIIKMADDALYSSKRQGRNRVSVKDSPDS